MEHKCSCGNDKNYISIGKTDEDVDLFVCLICGRVCIGNAQLKEYQEKYLKNKKEKKTNACFP